ncbi:MAG: glycine-rich domain-containing protein [Methylococcales bacterium]
MYLCALFPDGLPLAPTKVIDDGWHNFILFTHDYKKFCLDFLGRFIHHEPIDPNILKNGEHSLAQKTVNLARSHFGENLSKNWSVKSAGCKNCAPDPSCDASRSPSVAAYKD